MILISHRGNCNSINCARENTPLYIDEAIKSGFHVEIDVYQYRQGLWLGHDGPETEIELDWLTTRTEKLWVHCKNVGALNLLLETDLRCFFHESEKQTIIGNSKNIWTHDLANTTVKSVIPLLSRAELAKLGEYRHVYGICSDFVGEITDA